MLIKLLLMNTIWLIKEQLMIQKNVETSVLKKTYLLLCGLILIVGVLTKHLFGSLKKTNGTGTETVLTMKVTLW